MIIILVSPDNVMKALLSLMAFVRKMASDLLIRLDSFVCVCLWDFFDGVNRLLVAQLITWVALEMQQDGFKSPVRLQNYLFLSQLVTVNLNED